MSKYLLNSMDFHQFSAQRLTFFRYIVPILHYAVIYQIFDVGFQVVLFISRCFEFWKWCVRSHLGLNRRKLGLQIAICKYPLRINQPEPLPPCYLLSSMLRLITFIHYEIIIMYTECGACAYANCIVVRAVRVRR